MDKRKLPHFGVLLALALVLVSTRFYPGGTESDPAVVGFDWWRVYLTQLCRPVALNGQVNGARPYAVAGTWLFCLSMAEVFRQLSTGMASRRHAKLVQICGIGAMVYGALTVTRMHDLMVTISLVFFAVAELVLLDWVWRRKELQQWIAGMASMALLLVASFVYYRSVGTVALPTLQKLVFLSSPAWVLWLHKRCTMLPAAPSA